MPNTSSRIAWSAPDEVAQQLQAGPVRPLQIIEHEHDRLRRDTMTSNPTTAAKTWYRSVSASVAVDGPSPGSRLDNAGTNRASSDPHDSTWATSCSSGAWVTKWPSASVNSW